ncbi:hypothetical protein BLX87_23050 [Bacillus sp. VT-16-64]|nr:hypothetical protein BLX87_23050 [Bacillus sp. VT-16-64]
MNLSKLFEMQKPLRDKIIQNFNLENENLLENFIVAFQAELYELANEWKGFKHWSKNKNMDREKALEEFADCISFLLELGFELGVATDCLDVTDPTYTRETTIQKQLIEFNFYLYEMYLSRCKESWFCAMEFLLGLGSMLGFTEKEMVDAYYKKNAINHQRQETGY